MSEFVRADIAKLESFVSESQEAIQEFAAIRTEFDRINDTLLADWDGVGKNAYKKVAKNITEKIGGIKDVLDTINDSVVRDIIEQYNQIDKDLADYNRKAGEPQGSESNGG
jgi:uncharacterized protein YukE